MNKQERIKLFKGIRKTNAKFDKATKAEKRVMIAKDILKYCNSKVIVASHGKYVNFNDRALDLGASAQGELHKIPKCSVCALGSMAYAHVVRKNKCDVGEFNSLNQYRSKRMISDLFSDKQLALIECAFESTDHRSAAHYAGVSEGDRSKAMDFRDSYGCPAEERGSSEDAKALRLIMQNIIDNKGTFKL